MVSSLVVPQNSASAKFKGSKNLTIGLSSPAKDSRSALDSWTATDPRELVVAGAKAEAEATRVARIDAVFILGFNNLFDEGDMVKQIPKEIERARDGRQFLFLLPREHDNYS